MSPVPPMMTSFISMCLSVLLVYVVAECGRRSLDGRQNRCAFVLYQEHHELGPRGLARVSADDVHVVRSFIEGLARRQCDGSPTSDLHHDRAFKDVDHRLRIMRMYRVRSSWRVLDSDQ